MNKHQHSRTTELYIYCDISVINGSIANCFTVD